MAAGKRQNQWMDDDKRDDEDDRDTGAAPTPVGGRPPRRGPTAGGVRCRVREAQRRGGAVCR